jgi:hypothetical protein
MRDRSAVAVDGARAALEEGAMRRAVVLAIVLASVSFVSCTSAELMGTSTAEALAASTAGAQPDVAARPELEAVQLDLADASGPADVVCTKITRPGTRIVVGERCAVVDQGGINVQTREEIQREISGQGWASGWKTADQIAAERPVSLGR